MSGLLRDVWGLATALTGTVNQGDLRAHQKNLLREIKKLQASDSSAQERLKAMLILSQRRTHMALFPRRVSVSIMEQRSLMISHSARALEAILADPAQLVR